MNVLSKYFRRWERRRISVSKRQQFVIITAILTAGLLVTQLVPQEWRYVLVGTFSIATYALCAFGLRDELSGVEWFTLLLPPTLFTASVLLFYFLLPVRWLTRLPFAALYAVGMYAIILTQNIYNVAAERSIALLRAAHSVGLLLTLVTHFLLVSTAFSFRLALGWTAVIIAVASFFLVVPALWSVELGERISDRVWKISVVIFLCIAELAWVFGFWPVQPILISLFLTTCLYGSIGLAQAFLVEKLYKRTVREFGTVVVLVLFVILVSSRWRGFV